MRSPSFLFIAGLALLGSCSAPVAPVPEVAVAKPREVHTAHYIAFVPDEQEALLVLFPGFGDDAVDTRGESRIVDEAVANGVAVMCMEFNRHLFLSDAEADSLISLIAGAKANGIRADHLVLGGFSSGGNVAVLLAKRMLRSPDVGIAAKGVFVVDSPLDLEQLYPIWKKHAEHSPVPVAQGEGAFVQALLDSTLGNPVDDGANYKRYSPVTRDTATLAALEHLPLRLYTEPDTAWWRINRGDRYEDMNAFQLEHLFKQLRALGDTSVAFITTKGRGVQHGQRHPHAWSIVEEKDLVKWVLGLR